MKQNPNPEVFARTVLAELARLHGEVIATRLRLYQIMMWMRYPQSFEQMDAEDELHIQEFQKKFLEVSLNQCGLSSDATPPSTDDLYE